MLPVCYLLSLASVFVCCLCFNSPPHLWYPGTTITIRSASLKWPISRMHLKKVILGIRCSTVKVLQENIWRVCAHRAKICSIHMFVASDHSLLLRCLKFNAGLRHTDVATLRPKQLTISSKFYVKPLYQECVYEANAEYVHHLWVTAKYRRICFSVIFIVSL